MNAFVIPSIQAQYKVEPQLVIDSHGHSAMIKDITFSPDGKLLMSVSDDKTIRIWNTKTGYLEKTIRGQIGKGKEGRLYTVDISPDGTLLAVGGDLPKNEIRIYSRNTGNQIATLIGHNNLVSSISFAKNGKYLASGSGDKTVKIWDVSKLTDSNKRNAWVIATLSGHTDAVYDVAFSPNSKNLVSASLDQTLRFWTLNKDATTATSKIMKEHTKGVYCVDYSPDGRYIVSGGLDGKVVLWDHKGNFYTIIEKFGTPIYSISFSADVNKLLAMTDHGKIYLMPYGNNLGSFTKHNNTVLASSFSPKKNVTGGEVVATAGGIDNDIYIWDSDSGKTLNHIIGKGRNMWAAAFLGNNKIAFGSTYKKRNDSNKGPLEKTFDFATLKFGFQKPDENKYTRTVTSYKGNKIKRTGIYSIKVGNKFSIENTVTSGKTLRTYTYTKDGKIVTGSAGGLKLYDKDGTFIREFLGHTGEIWAVSVSADNKTLISASSDQTIKLWNLNNGENLVTLFVASDNEWVCWTPRGYYTASAGGEKYIGWHINKGIYKTAEYYPVHVFRDKFHVPKLVKMTIQYASFDTAIRIFNSQQNAAKVVSEEYDISVNLPPKIEWITPALLTNETSETKIKVKVKITSNYDITEVKILVNGRTLVHKRGFTIVKENSKREKFVEFEVPLVTKESRLQIFAANVNAKTISDERIVIYKQPSLENTEEEEFDIDLEDFISTPSLYVLTIGVSEFENPQYNLNFAHKDAEAITKIYKNQEGKLFDNVYTKELLNKNATTANILSGFKWLEVNASQKDVVVIFVATHGFNINNKFYILPHDGDIQNIPNTTINWENFSNVLGNLPSKVLMFLDACHSGNLGSSMAMTNTEALREMSSDQNGVVIMAASTGDESSLENPSWGHGAFTLALIEGMKGKADFRIDGSITLRELDLYVAGKVDELTNGKQHPTTQKPSTISTFTVAKYK